MESGRNPQSSPQSGWMCRTLPKGACRGGSMPDDLDAEPSAQPKPEAETSVDDDADVEGFMLQGILQPKLPVPPPLTGPQPPEATRTGMPNSNEPLLSDD